MSQNTPDQLGDHTNKHFFPPCDLVKCTDCYVAGDSFRFEEKENVSSVNNVKSSVQRGIRSALLEQYPHIESYMDQILPKKDGLRAVKWYVILSSRYGAKYRSRSSTVESHCRCRRHQQTPFTPAQSTVHCQLNAGTKAVTACHSNAPQLMCWLMQARSRRW